MPRWTILADRFTTMGGRWQSTKKFFVHQRREKMKSSGTIRILGVAAALIAGPTLALAQDAISAPAQKTIGATAKGAMVPSLAVLNSRGATLSANVLTLTGVGANSIVFADRPVRAAGHVLTKAFLKEWDEGADSFAKDPPNATISVLSADGASVEEAVVVLKAPKLDGDKLTFQVSVLEGGVSKADGPASLFIDWFAARGYGGRAVAGGFGGGWHGAWYAHPAGVVAGAAVAGAAVGAAAYGAAAAPYYYGAPAYGAPPCGYYPYPACY
jgi:hypothetical protein